MGSTSVTGGDTPDARFLTHHALKIKGFANVEALAESMALTVKHVEEHLRALASSGHAMFREARGLWQLTPEGRSAHSEALAADVARFPIEALTLAYGQFLVLNEEFKELCGRWQLRNGQPNDHRDVTYDAVLIDDLIELDRRAQPIIEAMSLVLTRLAPYATRLDSARRNVVNGDHKFFTGVMCGSYHDIWMELHEDLLLTQGIDRGNEGSF